jgi:hypothetical protein
MDNKKVDIEEIKQNLLDSQETLPSEKLELLLSYPHNINTIIIKICQRLTKT